MKTKKLVILYILILSLGTIVSLYIPKQEIAAQEAIVIPKDAIRLRILANSDFEEDQAVKRLVRDAVNKEIGNWVGQLSSKAEAKNVIKKGLPELQKIAEHVVESEGLDQTVKVEFGEVQFPTKLYGQFLYPAGEYEAVLITLGAGKGANWWCVLYPPLCFLDFSTGNAVRSPGFETTVEASGNEVTEVDSEDKEVDQVKETKHPLQRFEKERSVMEEFQDEISEEQPKEEPVFVEDREEEEVEVRFFVVDLVKELFK